MSNTYELKSRSRHTYTNVQSNYEINRYSPQYNKSTRRFRSLEKPASLLNYGANCYLNAGFQAISACSEFVKEIKQLETDKKNYTKLKTFNELMRELQNHDIKNILEISKNEIFQNWNKTGQQDSLELLTHVFNEIYDEIKTLNEIPKKKLNESLKLNLPMRIIFENKIRCCIETNVHTLTQCDLAFHIPIYRKQDSSSIKLEDLIDMFFTEEIIEDYSCEEVNCSGTKARKQTKLCLPFPNTICIHLQRLKWDNEKMHKIEDKVEFGEEIIMKKSFFRECTKDNSSYVIKDKKYYLKAVIVHYGDASCGHYICYRLFKNNWFYTSDSLVFEEKMEKILNCQAYILFYENVKDNQDVDNYKTSLESQRYTSRTDGIRSTNNSKLTRELSELNIGDNTRFDFKNFVDNSPEIQISQFENILIEALSSCSTFVCELKKINQKYVTDKNRKIINLILKQNSPFDYKGYSSYINFDYNDLKKMLISIFNNKLDIDIKMETNQENHIENYPFKFSFQYKIECHTLTKYSVFEVALVLEDYSFDLQNCIDKVFEKKDFVKTTICNHCSYGYRNIKLKSIPNIICIYIKNKSLLKINLINEIKIKKNYFSSDVDKNDYKYCLKSVVCNSWNKYECYRLYGDEWYHIADNCKKIDSNSSIWCEILFFEKIIEYKAVNCPTNKNFKISKNENSLINTKNEYYGISNVISDDMYYLKITLHALSSCKSFNKEIGEIISNNMEYSYPLSTNIESIDEQIENNYLLEEIVNKLKIPIEMNLFQFLSKLLSYILNKWPENPFLITKDNVVKCSNCDSVLKTFKILKMSFDIPVLRRYETIHLGSYIEKSFEIQNLDGVNCSREECSMKITKIINKLYKPFPRIICFHIENLIWNGKENEYMYADVKFNEFLTLPPKIFENQFNTLNNKLIYQLQSILSFNNHSTEYFCYKKYNENWYRISRSSRYKISHEEVFKSVPYVLFYEHVD